jgi:acyl dehydratase
VIDPQALLSYDFGNPAQTYSARDAILYALGLGLGRDPLDAVDLRFLDERDLAVLPTFAVTLCTPGMWIADPSLGVAFSRLVHSAQAAEFLRPLPASASVSGTAQVVSLTDRGEGRGAVLILERIIVDGSDGEPYCRLRQTLLLRADGGFGGDPARREPAFEPAESPDMVGTFATSSRAALIYRLSGDWNPLHLDPLLAQTAGFSRPILQGLASYGIAGLAVSRALGFDPTAVSRLACRFAGFVLPGDDITFQIWTEGTLAARFRAFVGTRKVLDGGEIAWRET